MPQSPPIKPSGEHPILPSSLVMNAKAETVRAGAKPAIADVLREGIRQGLLAPGQPLIQASIADAMGVSRITVYNYLNALHR